MFFASTLSLALALLPFVASQTIHNVNVSDTTGDLTFTPEAIFANPGDQVIFEFFPKNHTVTQSSFANPCGKKDGGFNSGFTPVAANSSNANPTYTVTVNDTTPIWVYCAQAANTANSHCGKGMVFAINCGADGSANSFSNFKNSALAIGAELQAEAASASTVTAQYATVTIPAAETGSPATATITLGSSTWTTLYQSYPNSPAPTPNAEPAIIKVVVGGPNGLVFDPPHVSAQPRDIVMFEFQQKNHTATRSSFSSPCAPLQNPNIPGFDSGFMPFSGTGNFPTFNLTINDTTPIWGYCRQTGHCGQGMVFSINSDEATTNNFVTFQQIAMGLNGTGNTTTASGSGGSGYGSSGKNGAVSTFRVSGAAVAIVFGAIVGSFL
jgi:plastocyanin